MITLLSTKVIAKFNAQIPPPSSQGYVVKLCPHFLSFWLIFNFVFHVFMLPGGQVSPIWPQYKKDALKKRQNKNVF